VSEKSKSVGGKCVSENFEGNGKCDTEKCNPFEVYNRTI